MSPNSYKDTAKDNPTTTSPIGNRSFGRPQSLDGASPSFASTPNTAEVN
jgi:hypothetical protein